MLRLLSFYSFVLLLALMVILIPGLRPAIAGDDLVVHFVLNQKHYFLNETRHIMDATTFAEKGRTYVPIRYLGEALGANVEWKDPMIILIKNNKTVQLMVGSPKILVLDNAAPIDKAKFLSSATAIDAAPLARNGRTYLPARFVAEALGYQVGWDAGTGTVTVSKDGNVPPPPVVNADPTNPPVEYDDLGRPEIFAKEGMLGWPVIKVETAQKLFGPLVPPQELIANGNKVALKWESRDVLLNPSTRINPNTYIEEPVGGTWLKNYLPAPYKTRTGEYVDRSGKKVKGQTQYFPLKEMLLLAGFPEQNIFWNPQTKTMVIYGSHFHQDDYYSVTKIVAGVEVQPKALVPAPLVENGSLLVSDGPYSYVVGKAFRSGDVPIYSRQIGTDLYIFD